jgi:SAM-dependent methyltransferase
MEAEWIDLPAASVDAVLCRWALMLLADPEAALLEVRRVLRPGGRVAVAVWDAPAANPWMTVAGRVLTERGVVAAPDPREPGPFALADAERLAELLWGAGLTDVRVEPLGFAFTAPSLDAWWDHLRQTSSRVREALADLAPAEHYAVRDAFDAAYAPYAGPDGAIRVPARALVAAAEA